ncbi:hypothetical protein H5410_019327 [Solanum commersonii]|uniref:Uncharacterized protein n=1 Tax=Solanum commersonii TaxID=4109 RepID=A0A9J5ZAU1_SOLCO|nr:hypothetical protein H5410_019327 [Solanum commersonii]
MWAVHGLCRLTDAHVMTYVAWLTCAGHDQCAYATAYVDWLMCACHDLCLMADARWPWHMTSGRCRRPRPMFPSQCAQATSDACRPWLMLPVVGRRRSADAHRPRSMHHTSPRTLREWGAREGLSILVFLGAFQAGVRWSLDERAGAQSMDRREVHDERASPYSV